MAWLSAHCITMSSISMSQSLECLGMYSLHMP